MALCLLAELAEQVRYFYSLRSPYRSTPDIRGTLIIALYLVLYKTIAATVLSFYWRGRDWALWFVLAEAAFTLSSLSRIVHGTAFTPQPLTPLTFMESALAVFLLYYLNARSTRAWFQ
jgi:hypothetical protein